MKNMAELRQEKTACPNFRSCYQLDITAMPLCPENYRGCIIFIKEKNPELYKEICGKGGI